MYKNDVGKNRAIIEQIVECHEKGQPVLVGTISIEKSEYISSLLKRRGIPHTVLNAKYHEKEAEIVAQAGKQGAVSLHRWVQDATLTIGRDKREFIELDKNNLLLEEASYDNTPRQRIGYNETLRKTFKDGRVAFTEEQVKAEAARCLGCGASVVDPNKCIGCGVCTTKCAFDAIHLHRERPECSTMYACEDKMKAILPYMIKRNIKIKKAERRAKKAAK